ncbi:MAG: LacI family DNA-binding transcriptional regulator [Candidatus Marinimicrobia bacterium]|nr:LacI family DNA-binding transcriptional regulator [Candidatus Neomarinimicrobiota bacterium]
MSKITITDIANKLNLSTSTVSRALSDHPEVSVRTREIVRKTARELKYRPNIIAQSLQRGQSNIIGVLVPQVRHVFFAEIMAGISDVMEKARYNILICQSNENYENEVRNVETLIQQRIAGLMVSISERTKHFDHFLQVLDNKIPLVFFDRICSVIPASSVSTNDYQAAFDLVQFLVEKGYRRIAHLAGFSNLQIAQQRFLGYKAALEYNKVPFDPELVVENGLNEEDGKVGFLTLYKRCKVKPDAIFAVTDPVAFGAFQEIKKTGLKIPDDIALAGFSNNPTGAMIEPSLTTVNQSAYDIGKVAAELLLDSIKNNKQTIIHKIIPTELIKRQST